MAFPTATDPAAPWTVLRSWSHDPLVIAGLLVATWWYTRAVRLLRRRGAHWPRARTSWFGAGIGTSVLALLSPLDVYAERLLSVHMVQHLLLMLVAPPLLLLGEPLTLALRIVDLPTRARLARILRSRTIAVITNPVLDWLLFVGAIWASHLPAFYDATLRSTGIHALEHLAYLSTALLFWRPIVGRDPGPARLSYPARLLSLFLLMPQMAFLGLAIYGSDRVLYAPYLVTSRLFGTTAVADQHLAGALMWSAGMFVIVPAMAAVLIGWFHADEREGARADARLERVAARNRG